VEKNTGYALLSVLLLLLVQFNCLKILFSFRVDLICTIQCVSEFMGSHKIAHITQPTIFFCLSHTSALIVICDICVICDMELQD